MSPGTATTPATLNVAYDPTGLTSPESCNGAVVLTPVGIVASPSTQVGVTLNVATTPFLNVSPQILNFSAPFGGDTTAPQTVNVSTTASSAVSFTVSAAENNPGTTWLQVTPASGSTTASLRVMASPNGLNVGTYSGTITVTSSNLGTATITVYFQVTATGNAVVAPTSLSFTQVAGGTAPPAQNLTITANGSPSYLATATTLNAQPWLSVVPVTGNTPATVAVSVSGGNMTPGVYTGSVILTIQGAGNSPVSIPVTLTITSANPQTIAASTTSLNFNYEIGAGAWRRTNSTLPAQAAP